jgi:crotonobetainyl-CoA:carnitine CoA-transferase CaiB-like acyl-CoA transferase
MGWMEEHGMLPGWLHDWLWEKWEPGWAMEVKPEAQAEMVRIEEIVEAFLRTRTKAEVYREGIRRRILVAPVATVADIAADPQLAFREYWRPVEDARLGGSVRFPGPFACLSATPLADARRPPEPGEHNEGIYRDLCGLDAAALARDGVI